MRKLRWLLLLGAVVLGAGCGLPDTYYLAPPQVSGTVQHQHSRMLKSREQTEAAILTSRFLGYELYYKFYATN